MWDIPHLKHLDTRVVIERQFLVDSFWCQGATLAANKGGISDCMGNRCNERDVKAGLIELAWYNDKGWEAYKDDYTGMI